MRRRGGVVFQVKMSQPGGEGEGAAHLDGWQSPPSSTPTTILCFAYTMSQGVSLSSQGQWAGSITPTPTPNSDGATPFPCHGQQLSIPLLPFCAFSLRHWNFGRDGPFVRACVKARRSSTECVRGAEGSNERYDSRTFVSGAAAAPRRAAAAAGLGTCVES